MIIRVFPRRTSMTPTDPYAFAGDPPLWRPQADEVHVSVAFTWDIKEGERLREAWAQYYPIVRLGGPALNKGHPIDQFTPGMYTVPGVTFTSRGCNNNCPWCLVPQTEGRLRTIPIMPGHICQDNNLLQCPASHRRAVFQMMNSQRRAASFPGGLDARLITDEVADELRNLRIHQIFLAADTEGAMEPLRRALRKLSFLPRQKLRCYVLLSHDGKTLEQAEARLRDVWEAGAMPFAQLYQPPGKRIQYEHDWKTLARTWARPAAMKAEMRGMKQ